MEENSRAGMPKLGSLAPDFEAMTTFGLRKLSDYKGKWLILFSHPHDFTPVCTTEFIAFAKSYEAFKERNVELLGLSVDGIYAHLAWVDNIFKSTGVEIPFPVISDLDMNVSRKYGMISPEVDSTSTIRSVYFIDPEQKIQGIISYPMNIGRNLMEILRVIDALQYSAKEKVATPANWMPGLPSIVPPPKTYEQLKKRAIARDQYRCVDWYLCFKDAEKDD